MKFDGDHVYFSLDWNGLTIAIYGILFNRDIDISLTLSINADKCLPDRNKFKGKESILLLGSTGIGKSPC